MRKIKNIKSFTLGLVIGLLVATGATVFATNAIRSATFNDTRIIFNGEELELAMPMISVVTEANPYGVSNFMPVRAALEAMGYIVDWDGERNAVLVSAIDNLSDETIGRQETIGTGSSLENPAYTSWVDLSTNFFQPLFQQGLINLRFDEAAQTIVFYSDTTEEISFPLIVIDGVILINESELMQTLRNTGMIE